MFVGLCKAKSKPPKAFHSFLDCNYQTNIFLRQLCTTPVLPIVAVNAGSLAFSSSLSFFSHSTRAVNQNGQRAHQHRPQQPGLSRLALSKDAATIATEWQCNRRLSSGLAGACNSAMKKCHLLVRTSEGKQALS